VAAKKRTCGKFRCSNPAYMFGLCKEHYEKAEEDKRRREAALQAFHFTLIDGSLPKSPELREELFQIQDWWRRACDALNFGRKDEVLLDDAEYAVEWCIALAKEIVDAEIAFRNGSAPSYSLESTREWVWARFHNLEKGLRSNGLNRPT
jgi:ATP:corrinoid adenosyltransferase